MHDSIYKKKKSTRQIGAMIMEQSFEQFGLSTTIVDALHNLHFTKPTNVQQKVIPHLLRGEDLVVQSKTGSGKTAAYGIPLCEKIDWHENKPQAVILTPTRELAAQVQQDVEHIGRYKRVKAITLIGKQSFEKQKLALKQKNHLVVGTPGRVLDHLEKGTLSLEAINYLIIDEADEMLNMGFIDQVQAIIEKFPKNRVTALFSATISSELEELCHKYMKQPLTIKVKADKQTTNIKQFIIPIDPDEKFDLLQGVLITENPDSSIVFCRTQAEVDRVSKQLKRLNYPCEKLHGGMTQEDRFSVMNQFKQAEFRYLVATDIAARGIDVADIPLIINYDIPLEKETYVHRVGRTGRAGKTGKAITFVTEQEDVYVKQIETYINEEIPIGQAPAQSEIKAHKTTFTQTINSKPKPRKVKNDQLDQQIMKLYFNGGKKKKIRAIDFVGTLTSINGVSANDIGIISIEHSHSYVDILNGKGPLVLKEMKNKTIKGKQLKVHQARK